MLRLPCGNMAIIQSDHADGRVMDCRERERERDFETLMGKKVENRVHNPKCYVAPGEIGPIGTSKKLSYKGYTGKHLSHHQT